MFSHASRSSGTLLAPMRALIAFLSQWTVVRTLPSCSSEDRPCTGPTASARSLTMSALVQTAALRSGSAETNPLRIETIRPTFGQSHLSDRQPEGAQPPPDRPAPAEARGQVALSPLVTLL